MGSIRLCADSLLENWHSRLLKAASGIQRVPPLLPEMQSVLPTQASALGVPSDAACSATLTVLICSGLMLNPDETPLFKLMRCTMASLVRAYKMHDVLIPPSLPAVSSTEVLTAAPGKRELWNVICCAPPLLDTVPDGENLQISKWCAPSSGDGIDHVMASPWVGLVELSPVLAPPPAGVRANVQRSVPAGCGAVRGWERGVGYAIATSQCMSPLLVTAAMLPLAVVRRYRDGRADFEFSAVGFVLAAMSDL